MDCPRRHVSNRWGRPSWCLFLLLLALTLALPIHGYFIVESPSEYSGKFTLALISWWPIPGQESWANTFEIVSAEFSGARRSPSSGNREGSIALFDSGWQGVYLIDDILKLQRENASAVVIGTAYVEPGRAVWILRERIKKRPELLAELRIPVFQVSNYDCDPLLQHIRTIENYTNYHGRITAEGSIDRFLISWLRWGSPKELSFLMFYTPVPPYHNRNPSQYPLVPFIGLRNTWLEAAESPGSVVIHVLFLLPSIGGLILTLQRLYLYLKYEGCKAGLPMTIMSLQILSHLLRIVFGIDPLGMRSVFDPFNALFWLTSHVCVGFISHFIVLFYWNRAMAAFGAKSIDFLLKYAYILIAVLIGLEVTAATLRSFELEFGFILMVQILYIIIQIMIISYIIYTAVGLSKFIRHQKTLNLNRDAQSRKRANNKIFRMTRLIIGTACILGLTITFSFLGFFKFMRYPFPEMVMWLIYFTALAVIGILEVLILRPGQNKKDTVRNSSSQTNTASNLLNTSSSDLYSNKTESIHTMTTKNSSEVNTEDYESIKPIEPRKLFPELDKIATSHSNENSASSQVESVSSSDDSESSSSLTTKVSFSVSKESSS